MSFKTSPNFIAFLELYKSNPDRVIFFVGAGLSMPLFPSWASFLKKLVNDTDEKGKLNYDKAEILANIENGLNFLEIADYCADAVGVNDYRDIIEKNFDREFKVEDIPTAYRQLLTIQFKSIITTNYDRIPEVGGQGSFSCYTNKNVSEALKGIERGKRIVLKIHGDILNQDSIVLTQEDFKNIIHNNITVQNALRSLFSTATICFLGFGFSDPHFNLILDFLNSVNNGQNIIHYALLPTRTKFATHSMEKKYGIRTIEYSPSDNSHPEIEEFINELNGKTPTSSSKLNIDSEEDLLKLIENSLQSMLGVNSYYIDFNSLKKSITINFFTRANTEHEQQREILSFYKLFNFDTSLIDEITVCNYFKTQPFTEVNKFSPLFLVINSAYSKAAEFANKELTDREFWQSLNFNQPYNIGNIHFTDRKVLFPFINF